MYIKNSEWPQCGSLWDTTKIIDHKERRYASHTQHSVSVLSRKNKSNLAHHILHRDDSTLATKDDEVLYQKP